MKILFITDNFPPEVNAPATRTYEHCIEWIKSGAEVTVLTCHPNFPSGKVFEGYHNSLCAREKIDGIKVIRLWSYMSANEGFLKRTLDYLSFAEMAFWAGLFVKTDVIIATSPQFFTTLTGWFLSIFKRRPWIFEVRDLWPESIVTVGAMKKGALVQMLEKLELFLYRRASKIIVVTPAFQKNLVSRGIDAQKISIVTNGANLELFTPQKKDPALLAELGLKGKFVIGYIGTHGMAHGLDFIIDSAAHIASGESRPDSLSAAQNRKIHFLFIGAGAMKQSVVEQAQKHGLKNVTFLDPVSKEEVGRYLSLVDVSLVSLRKSDTFKTVIPSKIFEAAAMGKPSLLGVDGQARQIVEKHKAGLFYKPENQKDFINKVYRLYQDKILYRNLKEGAFQLARAYDRKKLAQEMLQYVIEVADGSRSK